jgi:peroxiredoxin
MKKIVWGLILFLIIGAFATQVADAQFPFLIRHPLVGKAAPDFTLSTLTKKDVNFSEFRDGQTAVLFFWATWCPHCRVELKVLSERKDELQEKGIKLVLIDIEETAEQITNYLNMSGISVDVFLDKDAVVAESYSIMGVPSYFLVNNEGIVESVEHVFPENLEKIVSVNK